MTKRLYLLVLTVLTLASAGLSSPACHSPEDVKPVVAQTTCHPDEPKVSAETGCHQVAEPCCCDDLSEPAASKDCGCFMQSDDHSPDAVAAVAPRSIEIVALLAPYQGVQRISIAVPSSPNPVPSNDRAPPGSVYSSTAPRAPPIV